MTNIQRTNLEDGIVVLKFDRPDSPANIFDFATLDELESHLEEVARERGAIRGSGFVSHADLRKLLGDTLRSTAFDAVFMTAAVADYTPAGAFEVAERTRNPDGTETWRVRNVAAGKVKSHYAAVAWLGRRTEKLVDLFRTEWGFRGLLVKFKLEVGIDADELVRIGQVSRAASGADYLVANTLEMTRGDGAGAFLLGDGTREWLLREQLAGRLARLAREWVEARG